MNQIDWSKAPDDATHYHPRADGYVEHWIKPGFFCTTGFESEGWKETLSDALRLAVPRPAALPAWNGPEDGLPPVGADVEWMGARGGYWVKARIIAEDDGSVVIQNHKGEKYKPGAFEIKSYALTKFRPIRTPEQIAAEERGRSVEQMVADLRLLIVGGKEFSVCEALYDAGYRKQADK